MFRDGQAAEAVKALEEDGRFHLVAGGREATVAQTAKLWRTMTEANQADPDYSLLVMTDTNAHALEIGMAIRGHPPRGRRDRARRGHAAGDGPEQRRDVRPAGCRRRQAAAVHPGE